MQRVGLVSFMHESNTFNSVSTTRNMFEETCLVSGERIRSHWEDAHHEIGGMLEETPRLGFEIIPLLTASAQPAGPLQEQCFEQIVGELLETISAESLDGLLLSLHGAMVAEHIPDADGESVERIRKTVGDYLPVVLTLDLHANVSQRMISNVSATTVYRTYPHLDQRERGREAARILADIIRGKIHPIQALVKPPLEIHILAQHTDREPMMGLYRKLEELIPKPGIISASIALGFAYADVEEMGASFLVIADGDEELAHREAAALARQAWDLREAWNVTGLPIEEAVEEARRSDETPVTLLDAGDNVGGGSPGDGTKVFAAVHRAGMQNALVILYDPDGVRTCSQAGVGNTVSLKAGGKTDQLHGEPLEIAGRVRVLHDGHFIETRPRHGGRRWNNQGLTAVVETAQEHTIILTSLRMAPFSLEQIRSLGIEPESKTVLIAKGAIAPRAAYEPVSARVIEVDSPGITAPNPARFTYQRRRRPMFPFEPETTWDAA